MAEIIVVDNGSTDGSCPMIAKDFPAAQLIQMSENSGFSAANNIGVNAASRDFVLLLNPDTELTDNGLDNLILFFEHSKNKLLAGPKLLNTDGSLQPSTFNYPTLRSVLLEVVFLHRIFPTNSHQKEINLDKPIEVKALSGAAIMIRKDFYQSIGGFDNNLFWVEDVDLCYRACKNGARIFYLPSTKIIHHGGKSSTHAKPRVIANQLMSRLKYFKKHRSRLVHALASVLILMHILSRIIASFVMLPFFTRAKSLFDSYRFSLYHYYLYTLKGDNKIIT